MIKQTKSERLFGGTEVKRAQQNIAEALSDMAYSLRFGAMPKCISSETIRLEVEGGSVIFEGTSIELKLLNKVVSYYALLIDMPIVVKNQARESLERLFEEIPAGAVEALLPLTPGIRHTACVALRLAGRSKKCLVDLVLDRSQDFWGDQFIDLIVALELSHENGVSISDILDGA